MGTRVVLRDAAGNLVDLGSDDLMPDEVIERAHRLLGLVRGTTDYQTPKLPPAQWVTTTPVNRPSDDDFITHGLGATRSARHASVPVPTPQPQPQQVNPPLDADATVSFRRVH